MIRFHHVNISWPQMPELVHFYKEVLGLEDLPGAEHQQNMLVKNGAYTGRVAFLLGSGEGEVQLHLCDSDPDVGFKTGHAINPVMTGHLAFRTDDLDAVKANLDAHGIRYSYYGTWGMSDWDQIFLYDPAGNIVEIHQVVDISED